MLVCTVLLSKLRQGATALFTETMSSRVIEPTTHARQETLSLPGIASDLYQPTPARVRDAVKVIRSARGRQTC